MNSIKVNYKSKEYVINYKDRNIPVLVYNLLDNNVDLINMMMRILGNDYNKVYITSFLRSSGVHSTYKAIDLGARENLNLLYKLWNELPKYGYSCFIADEKGGTGLHLHIQNDGRGRKGVETKVGNQDTWVYNYDNSHIVSLYGVSGTPRNTNGIDGIVFNKEIFIYLVLAIMLILGSSK